MTRLVAWIAATGILIGGMGCGLSSRPRPPSLTAEEVAPIESDVASQAVENLIEENIRLINLEYALTTVSARRCGALARPQSGMILSGAKFFEDRVLRKTVSREYEIDKDLRVMHVVPGSSADKADIRVGDELLSVDGERLIESAELRMHLLKMADRSSIDVVVERNGVRTERTVELERGCPVVFKLTYGSDLTAQAWMQLVVLVTPGLLREVADDNVLAVVLAHQLAHTCFDDKSKFWAEQEAHADRLGLIIAAQAGFDVEGAAAYWEMVATEYPWLIDEAPKTRGPSREGFVGYTHYGIANRMAGIRKTVAEINARRAAASTAP